MLAVFKQFLLCAYLIYGSFMPSVLSKLLLVRGFVITALLVLFYAPIIFADEDTSLQLQQRLDLQNNQQEQKLLEQEDVYLNQRPILTINGKNYPVLHNVDDVGRALYFSIQHKDWPSVVHFFAEYQTFPHADPLLVSYALGVLARLNGEFNEAERHFRHLLELQPGFLLAELELGRVLFENRKNSQAEAQFSYIASLMDANDPKTKGVQESVKRFQDALDTRESWQGSLVFGPSWGDNINKSSQSVTCLVEYLGTCLLERRVPDAISDTGLNYQFSLQKREAVVGNHGYQLRLLSYGDLYQNHSAYNENTVNLFAAYSWHSAAHQWSVGPTYEMVSQGSDPYSSAWGAKADWLYSLSAGEFLRFEGNYSFLSHKRAGYEQYDGSRTGLYATYFKQLPDNWGLIAGVDASYLRTESAVNNYRQVGIRLGLNKTFAEDTRVSLFSAVRRKNYGQFNALLGAQRADTEQNLTLKLNVPRWSFQGVEPSLSWEYQQTNSNVDWLYSQQNQTVKLQLQKTF